ncbi:MAG: hypothetical protein Q8O55_03905, partial [Dehalococcoidales bacterium]|nr:hypothetical protein [Dehalococcoidales bacterium]
ASWEDADIIYASPTAWLTAKDIASNSSAGAGYPSIIKVSTKNYFYVYGKQVSSTDTDTWGGNLAVTTSMDGTVGKRLTWTGPGESWANLISAATANFVQDSQVDLSCVISENDATHPNTWINFDRSVLLFDTSSLPDSCTVTAAILSLYGYLKNDDAVAIAPNINVYASNPASNIKLATGDFNSFGPTPFCDTPITYAAWSLAGYNAFALNAAGIAAISKTEVSKFGARNANYDVAATPPTWTAGGAHYLIAYATEQGIGYKPKLVVTYTVPPVEVVSSLVAKLIAAGVI